MTEQAAIAADLAESVRDLRPDDIVDLPVDQAAAVYVQLVDVQRELAAVMSLLTHGFAESLGERETTIDGIGTFRRRGRKDRTKWQKDDLLRAVLNSRAVDFTGSQALNTETGEVVDRETGEIIDESAVVFVDETPLDKVLAVWNLAAPRTTALKDRGIDPDEFCTSEWGGWTIEVIR